MDGLNSSLARGGSSILSSEFVSPHGPSHSPGLIPSGRVKLPRGKARRKGRQAYCSSSEEGDLRGIRAAFPFGKSKPARRETKVEAVNSVPLAEAEAERQRRSPDHSFVELSGESPPFQRSSSSFLGGKQRPGLVEGLGWDGKGSPTVEGVRSLIQVMVHETTEQKAVGSDLKWHQQLCMAAGTRDRQLRSVLDLKSRTVGMLLLEQCCGALLAEGCQGSDVVSLAEALLEGGLHPDVPLCLLLLEQLWVRGDQQQVVLLLGLLHRHRVGQGRALEAAERVDSARVGASERAISLRSLEGMRGSNACASVHSKLAVSQEHSRGPLPGLKDRALPKLHPAPDSNIAARRPAMPRGSSTGSLGGKTQGKVAEQDKLAALRSEIRRRALEQTEATARERAARPTLSLDVGLKSDFTGSDQSSGDASPASHSGEGEAGDGETAGPDFPFHVIQLAVDRAQYRAALALPRRLRQDGVRLSVEAYDSALLAVVKEQELITVTGEEVKHMVATARLEPMSTVDHLLFQVYGETIRSEGQHILDWALEEVQSSANGEVGASKEELHLPQTGLRVPTGSAKEEAPVECSSGGETSAGVSGRTQATFPSTDAATAAAVSASMERASAAAAAEATLHEKMLALWCLAGESERAEQAMWRIAGAGRPLSGDVIAAVLGACSFKGDMERVNRLLHKVEVLGQKLDSSLFSLIVSAAMRGGHLQVAAAAMLMMVDRGLAPNQQQMSSLLKSLQREGHVELYLVLCSALSGAGFVGPCLVFLYLDFINFCIIRML